MLNSISWQAIVTPDIVYSGCWIWRGEGILCDCTFITKNVLIWRIWSWDKPKQTGHTIQWPGVILHPPITRSMPQINIYWRCWRWCTIVLQYLSILTSDWSYHCHYLCKAICSQSYPTSFPCHPILTNSFPHPSVNIIPSCHFILRLYLSDPWLPTLFHYSYNTTHTHTCISTSICMYV